MKKLKLEDEIELLCLLLKRDLLLSSPNLFFQQNAITLFRKLVINLTFGT
jgi:hypothetical protein